MLIECKYLIKMEYIKKSKKTNKKNKKDNINQENQIKDNIQNDKVKYFLMIPLEKEDFIKTFNEMIQKLENEKPKEFDKNLLMKPQKLHLTLAVLDINEDKEKTEQIKSIINDLIPKIKEIINNEFIFNFDKYDCFDSIKKAKVIFAKMLEDENHYKLKSITNLIIKGLIKGNILNKDNLKNLKIFEEYSDGELIYTVKFHATLLNLKYLNRALQEENKNIEKKEFDASDIMECIKNIQFPECLMDKINLCAMREDQISGKYEVIHSFNLL